MSLHQAWRQTETSLERRWAFKNFKLAMSFAQDIGAIAEEQRHHPDLRIGWGYLVVTITTHDAGNRLTEKDFRLAEAIDRLSSP